jgi:hypothetical protein
MPRVDTMGLILSPPEELLYKLRQMGRSFLVVGGPVGMDVLLSFSIGQRLSLSMPITMTIWYGLVNVYDKESLLLL